LAFSRGPVQVAKFLVAAKPARNCRPVWHPGIGTNAAKAFATGEAVSFHELGHATGHKSRLDRDLRCRFGEKAYAAEELIAELCAAFLCAEFSLDGELRHAGYIQSWIGLLKTDCRAFFTACSKAQAAADYLRGLALRDQQPTMAA
jgi:antirestriction protein ArdC